MPGIPKSTRCPDCKRRKIKCDLQWPTCTPCIKAGIQCQGPSNTTKFVHDGCHAMDKQPTPDRSVTPHRPIKAASARAAAAGISSIVAINSRCVDGGSQYGYFRLAPTCGPKKYPTTVSDRLAAQLVRLLEKDTSREIVANARYLEHIPTRLGESPALRDCVALFCSAWGNYRRELFSNDLMPPKAYGKALRSLQRALHNPDEQLRAETLGAVTVMERCNTLFDCDRNHRPVLHIRAMHDIMKARGPPNLDDDLDLLLAMENRPSLLTYWVVAGGENFYQTAPWRRVMDQALKDMEESKKPHGHDCFLNDAFEQWPVLTQEARAIYDNPESPESQQQALITRDKVMALWLDVREACPPLMELAFKIGVVDGSPDWDWSPSPEVAEEIPEASQLECEQLTGYLTLQVILTRLVYDLSLVIGYVDEHLFTEYWNQCQLTWAIIPYLRRLGPIATSLHVTPCYLSFEVAMETAEREQILNFIIDANRVKKNLPPNKSECELFILNTGRAMTGRRKLKLDELPTYMHSVRCIDGDAVSRPTEASVPYRIALRRILADQRPLVHYEPWLG